MTCAAVPSALGLANEMDVYDQIHGALLLSAGREGKAVSRPPQRACELPRLSAAPVPLSLPTPAPPVAPGSAQTVSGLSSVGVLGRLGALLCWAHAPDVGTVPAHDCEHDVWALAGRCNGRPCMCLLYGRRFECGGISGGSAEKASPGGARPPESLRVASRSAGTALAMSALNYYYIYDGFCDPVSTFAGSPCPEPEPERFCTMCTGLAPATSSRSAGVGKRSG